MDPARVALAGPDGRLPRRAILREDGRLYDKTAHPDRAEVPSLSLCCEAMRRAAGEPVWARGTSELLAQCLGENRTDAWRALMDDFDTRDLDGEEARAFFGRNPAAAGRLVWCVARSPTGMHLWLATKALHGLLDWMSQEDRQAVCDAFQRHFVEIVMSLTNPHRDIALDMACTSAACLGRVVGWCGGVPDLQMAQLLRACLEQRPRIHDAALYLFLQAPLPALVALAPELVDMLVDRAENVYVNRRYAPCAMLSLLSREQLAGVAERVRALVHESLRAARVQRDVTAKLALVFGLLGSKTAPVDSYEACLAHALSCTGHLLCRPDAV